FHLLDCSIVADGGAALVLTTAERARDLKQKPVYLLGGGMEVFQGAYAHPPVYRDVGRIGRDAARRSYEMAGVTARDIDVFSLYDPNSFEVIRQMEVLGLCAEGEGGDFIRGGTLDRDGKAPTNLEGGLLSHSWNGTQQLTLKVIECVRQVRGIAGDRQVPS